jgi:hypothetical protein
MKTLAIVVLSGLIAACATQQGAHVVAAGVDPSAGVKPEGAMAASTPVGTTIAASPVADPSAKNPDVINRSYIKSGYKAAHRNGELVYCRSEIITGTLLPNTVCLTDAQMKTAEQNRQDMVDQLGKSRSVDCRVYKCN